MKLVTVISANAGLPEEVDRTVNAVEFIRQAYRDEGFVTHVDKREVVCGQFFYEYTITAIKEDDDG